MKPIVIRGSKNKPIIMEVVSEEGRIVGEYKDTGKDVKAPYHFLIERQQL